MTRLKKNSEVIILYIYLLVFFDLCDEDGSGKISEKEILKILK